MDGAAESQAFSLVQRLGERLVALDQSLATAESCTGGKLSASICAVPGASRYFMQGAVVYSNAAKVSVCGVRESTIAKHGAVSQEVAEHLAAGIRSVAGTDWGVGITGVAGPDGGTADKPVGTVHIAVAASDFIGHREVQLKGTRDDVTDAAVLVALEMLVDGVGQP